MGKATQAPRRRAQKTPPLLADGWAKRHPERAAAENRLRLQRAAMIADWSHKTNGTIETHYQASRVRQGAIARLFQSGRLDNFELGWAMEIRAVVERIGRDVSFRTASLETRVDTSRHGDAFWEALGAVRAEAAYSRWRRELGPGAGIALAIIVDDVALTAAARRFHVSAAKAGAMLEAGLRRWGELVRETCKQIGKSELSEAHARIA